MGSSPSDLSRAEAAKRLIRYGPNEIAVKEVCFRRLKRAEIERRETVVVAGPRLAGLSSFRV